jgi:uncharacterized phiE125 gp8 family phage protein
VIFDAGPDRLLRLVTPPTALAVTLDEAKTHLRVEDSESDALIVGYIGAAQDQLGYVGRAFAPATYALDLSFLPFRVELPIAPVRAISAVKVTDTSGTETTLSPSLYKLFVRTNGIGEVRLAAGQSWPPMRGDLGSASIEFTAGYDPDALPPGLRAAILLITGRLFEERSDSTQTMGARRVAPLLGPVDDLVAPFRISPGV